MNNRALGLRALELREFCRREEALFVLGQALSRPPELAWLHAVRGEILRELGGRRSGYGEIQRAVRLDPQCSYAEDFLKSAGGRAGAWVYGCRGGGLRLQGRLEEAERDLEKAVDLDVGCGWAWGWLGEARLRLGRNAQALAALDKAVALFAESPEVFAWRGEARRLEGMNKEAESDLDYAVALGGGRYDVHLSRSQARLARGDKKGYMADLTEAVRAAPEVFKRKARELDDREGARELARMLQKIEGAQALLTQAEKAFAAGKTEQALPLLGRCARMDSGCAKAVALRARINAGRRSFEEAFKDADSAVRMAPSADHYALRADIGQNLGYMEASLKDLSLAVSLAPTAAMLRWRAQTFLGMRHYDLALKDLSAALELAPDDPSLYDLRAQTNLVLGRLPQSLEDVERAVRLSPESVHLHLRRGQNLALQKRFAEAHEGLGPIRRTQPAWARFIDGYIRCVAKRYALAAEDFKAAFSSAAPQDVPLRRQAGFYAAVAAAVGADRRETDMKAKAKKDGEKGKVYLCGLGVFPPQTATVEVLRAISECDVVFNNLPGLGISEFLGLFCDNRRPVAFRYEQDAKLCADLVLSEVKPGRTVAFITFGHPLLFGPLSHEIILRCRKEGIPCKAFGAVSSMDAVLAASGQVLGFSYGGYQLFETTGTKILDEIAEANPRLPIIVFFADGMSGEWLAALGRILTKLHSSAHRCLLYGPKHELWETTQDSLTVAELAGMSHHKIAQGILFVPPKNGSKG